MSYDQTVSDLVEYSTLAYDIRQIESEADYFGEDPKIMTQDVVDYMAFLWNRMTRQDLKFNDYQNRLKQLHEYLKERN